MSNKIVLTIIVIGVVCLMLLGNRKVRILPILSKQFQVFKNAKTGKISIWDVLCFIILPIILALLIVLGGGCVINNTLAEVLTTVFVSPGLFSIQKKYLNEQNVKEGEFFVLYQILVKNVKERKFAQFHLTAAQKPTIPEELRDFYKTTLLPEMGQKYDSDDDQWHDATLSKIEINSETKKEDIIRFLEKGLAVGEWIERRLMYLSRVSRKN